MPAWWGKKSSKNKEDNNHNNSSNHFNFIKFSTCKSDSDSNSSNNNSNKKKPTTDDPNTKSCDDVIFTRNSPRESRDFAINGAGSSGFLGFDSDSVEKRGHPLPRPSVSSMHSDHGISLGSGYASVSSVSSSGSSEDHVIGTDQIQFGGARSFCDPRVTHSDGKFSLMPRSPGPGSRGPTSPTSPLHPWLSGVSLESPSGRLEDGKSQCHRLPLPPGSPTHPPGSPTLPPGSPTSPLTLPTSRTENTLSNWKKGKLLGRGTFGHVYLGFNR